MNIKDLPSVKTKQNKSNHIKSIQIKPTNQITHHTTHLITFLKKSGFIRILLLLLKLCLS